VAIAPATSVDGTSEPSVDPTTPSGATTDPTKDATDFAVVPGERVGAITANTSRADLVSLFGEASLTDEEVPVGEGMFQQGTRVNLGDGRSLSVLWSDESRTQISEVRDFGTAWKLPEGIGVGTSFTALQDVLGPFQLYGFGWDYGGTLSLDETPLATYGDSLVLRVQPEADVSASEYDTTIMGEQLVSDSDPSLRSLDLQVSEMIVYLNP